MEQVDICYSGGAKGADTEWGKAAYANGHEVIHYSFDGHAKDWMDHVQILTQEQLNQADQYLHVANKTLGRRFPTSNDHVNNLLRRNYYQIKNSNSLYAVASFEKNEEWDRYDVKGGTAWAVQMFIDFYGTDFPCFVYDQENGDWYTWDGDDWVTQDKWQPSKPVGKWTGIGSRDLTEKGKLAIWQLWN